MRSLRAALAAAVAALALLGGCADDDPSPSDPASTWTPTGTPETPTSDATPKPTEPTLPEAATKATEDGARAFIAYYWDLINYAQVTGDVKALKQVSGPNCDRCRAGIQGIRSVYDAGGHLSNAEYRATVRSLKEVSADSGNVYAFEGRTDVSNAAHVSVDADGNEESFKASKSTYLLYVLWADDHWRLDVMERA